MRKIFAYSIAASLLAGSSLALAEGPDGDCGGKRGEARFEQLDTNKDGTVSKDEFVQKRAAHFDQADANKDGKLTQAERAAAHEARMKERMQKRADKHGDETLTREQMKAKTAEKFAKLDANNDGKLSSDELKRGHHGRGRHH
jgi:hypothetical protein